MPSLTIALEEGFSGEQVRILLDGEVVFDQADVRTRMQLGMARMLTVEVSPGTHRIQVQVTPQGEPVEMEIDPATAPVVRVSRDVGGLSISASDAPPRYL
ncbi:hypothetical protein ACFFMN_03505 [Planobispora siamensis]|uniref:Uncharacterized protein n=1 Tax=Planobispora siamensis TaxID=936338 RepID=A0A8J3SR01_9ACTN|nr:hypothetical protein [Planobispora siamensis]GIH97754.1 hypothetical protein Psi01_83840 [Planobispora siamensis]